MEPIVLSIQGQPPRKSNNRRVVRNRKTGKRLVIKSQKALDWLEAAAWQIPAEAKRRVGGPDQPLRIIFYVRYETRHPDLSTELILDMLQETGVIKDDRYVFEKVECKQIDKENPGVDLVITTTEEHNLTQEQRKVIISDLAHVPHTLVGIKGPFEDGSILTHWSDGEWFAILADGGTTGYYYENEGQQDNRPLPPAVNGEENTRSKLRKEDVLQIRRLCDSSELSYQDIGGMFDVTASNVRRIGSRQIWQHVPEEEYG